MKSLDISCSLSSQSVDKHCSQWSWRGWQLFRMSKDPKASATSGNKQVDLYGGN